MFNLDKSEWKIVSVKARNEFHGEETKGAIDVTFEAKVPNTFLDMFEKGLINKFFSFMDDSEADMVDGVSEAPTHPCLPLTNKQYNLDWEGQGYTMNIHTGIDDKEACSLIDCSLNDFKFTCFDGGMIELKFHLASLVHQGSAKEISQMAVLMKLGSVQLTLQPPKAG